MLRKQTIAYEKRLDFLRSEAEANASLRSSVEKLTEESKRGREAIEMVDVLKEEKARLSDLIRKLSSNADLRDGVQVSGIGEVDPIPLSESFIFHSTYGLSKCRLAGVIAFRTFCILDAENVGGWKDAGGKSVDDKQSRSRAEGFADRTIENGIGAGNDSL